MIGVSLAIGAVRIAVFGCYNVEAPPQQRGRVSAEALLSVPASAAGFDARRVG